MTVYYGTTAPETGGPGSSRCCGTSPGATPSPCPAPAAASGSRRPSARESRPWSTSRRSSATGSAPVHAPDAHGPARGAAGEAVRVAEALAAWAKVLEHQPTWTLRVIGDGPLGRSLVGKRDQMAMQGSVQFVGETPAVVAEEWAKASIALSTAEEDAVGLSLMEAQAAGVPVVAYDSPNAVREVVAEGGTGLLTATGDTDALASALLHMIENNEMRGAMGHAAVEAAERFRRPAPWDDLLAALDADRRSGRRAEERARRVAAHALVSGVFGGRPPSPPPSRRARSTPGSWRRPRNAC